MRKGVRPLLRSGALSACAAGLALACGAVCLHAADAGPAVSVDAKPAPGTSRMTITVVDLHGKADRLAPSATGSGEDGLAQTTITRTIPRQVEAIPVETVRARVVSRDEASGQTTPAKKPRHAEPAAPAYTSAIDTRQPPAQAHTPPADTKTAARSRTPATPAPTVEASSGGESEIQWSSPQKAPGGNTSAMPAAGRINPTNRTVDLMVPLRDGDFYLGDVVVRITPQDEVSMPKDRLLQVLTPILRPAVLDTLKNLAAPDNQLSLAALKGAGFDIRYDAGKSEIRIALTIEQRATGKLSMGRSREQPSENLSQPAIFASYLNMRAGADYTSQMLYRDEGTANARVGFDGAARWLDVVFESAAAFDMNGGFTRGGSRFVYDSPENVLRLSAGDVSPPKAAFQGGADILGVSIEKSYQKLQPATSIHPTGSQSFRIERPSNVDVVRNGRVAQKLHLRPGDYDMSDLPLSVGANDITLIIEDDLGQRRTLNFSVFSGRALLAPGISQWALSAGVASHYDTRGLRDYRNLYSTLEYDFDTPVVTGSYERGLTSAITGNAHFQAMPNVAMGGAGAAFQTSFGFFTLDGAASESVFYGPGYGGKLGYELVNIEGGDGVRRSFRLAVDYRSEKFATVSVLEPVNDTMLGLSASYSQELPWDLSGSVSSSYSVGRGDHGDRYGADVSLARSFGPSVSAGLNVGYEQSTEPRGQNFAADGFKAAIRLGYRINERSSLDANHDARYGQSQVEYRYQEGSGVGSWNAQAELDRTPGYRGSDADHYDVTGSLGYTANRAELSLSQHTGLAGIDSTNVEQRTSVTAGTAIAFADGKVATGRPVSNGFAIVGTHANLPDSNVAIGTSQDAARATSDFLGPALVGDMSPYAPSRVPVDVSNLPTGYDLGAGSFDLLPGYKSGYLLTVGSDYTVSTFGTLLDTEGKPVELLTGTANEEGHPNDHTVTIFTNRAGKFAAQGMRPGRWIVDMATDPKTRFVIDIPKDTVGLFKAGELKPAGNVQ